MDAAVALIPVALAAAAALVLERPRAKAAAMLVALVLTPIVLLAQIWNTDQVHTVRDHPAVLVGGVLLGLAAVAALTALFLRRPAALPLLAVATLPFRVPIAAGGSTANLLVPLYLVLAGGALAYVIERLRPPRSLDERTLDADPPTRALEWVLAATLVLYAVQSAYSVDPDRALENGVFFYVPFALLFVLLRRIAWTPALLRRCAAVLVVLALALVGVGFVEYATRHLFLNPKVLASNQLGDAFRVNSLFFDPNIFGRFIVLVMLVVTSALLWARRPRDVAIAAALLVVLWGGLLLTLSQSSFTALLVGLAVLAGLRWNPRRAWLLAGGIAVVAVAVVVVAGGAVKLDLGSSASADKATSGRWELVKGGARMFADRPVGGWGSGAFPRQYRRSERASAERATSASHTIPLTVAAEQGVVGLALYLALLWFALRRLLSRARESPWRAAVAACFVALLAHTLMYAAFLEDPLSWALLGVGSALAFSANRHRRRASAADRPAAARESIAQPV